MTSFVKRIDRYALGVLIAVEMVACYNFYCREIAWVPPENYDESVYLAATYRTKEQILTNGFGQLASIVKRPYNTGMTLPILGALSGLCLTGARLPVLLVPFLAFVVLQVNAFITGRTLWRSRTYGYILLGLILCLNTPWYWAGGLFDFRYDFMAFSLYGIWACAVMQSQLFLDRRWAITCGLIGTFLALSRFLTLVYLLGVSAGFAVVCIAIAFLGQGDKEFRRRMRRRFYNLVLSVGVLAVTVTPFVVFSWRQIFQYYGGQLGRGSVRAHQGGLDSLAEQLLFYPNSILRDHWGVAFVLAAAVLLCGSLSLSLVDRKRARKSDSTGSDETFALQIIFLLGAIAGPLAVLTVDPDKNSVVAGIVGVPVALLVVAISARVTRDSVSPVFGGLASASHPLQPGGDSGSAIALNSKTVFAGAIVVFALGLGTVADRLCRHNPEYSERADLMRLVELDKWMVSYASDQGWYSPGISLDTISPWFNGYSATDTGYEETGKFVEFHPLLGADIMGADRQEALAQLAQSDFFVFTTPTSQNTRPESANLSPNSSRDSNYQWLNALRRLSPRFNPVVQPAPEGIWLEGSTASIQRWPALRQHLYPFYGRLEQYHDELKAWADKNMTLAQTVPFENFTAKIYVRQTATRPSLSDSVR